MEETIREMMKDCSSSFSNIEGDISDIVRQSQYRIINRLVEVIQERLNFINENHVVDPVISTYLPQIVSFMKKINDKNHENLFLATKALINSSYIGKTSEQLYSMITLRTNEITRRQNPERLYDINQEFAHDLTRTILRRFEQTSLFSERQLDDLNDELRHDIKRVLDKESDSLMEQYQEALSLHLKKFLSRSEERLLENKQKQKLSEEVGVSTLKNAEDILKKLNIDVLDVFDSVQVKNEDGKYMPLYQQGDGSLITKDESIEILINNSKDVMVRNEDRIIHYQEGMISFGPRKYPDQSVIDRSNGTYNIYYGGTLVEDPIKKNIVIEKFKRLYPALFDEMMLDVEFQAIVTQIGIIDEQANPYEVGENSRPIFRDENKTLYYEILSSLGYGIKENEEGFYLVDMLGEHKVVAHPNYLSLEDIPGITIKPLLYIIVEKRISGPFFEIETPDYSAIVSQDYNNVNLFSGDYHFSIRIDNGELVAKQENRNDNKLIDAGQTVIDKMQTMIPGIIAKSKSNAKGEDITNLLDELDSKEKTEEAPITSVEDELDRLREDPNVIRYIELMKMKSEMEELSTSSGPKM